MLAQLISLSKYITLLLLLGQKILVRVLVVIKKQWILLSLIIWQKVKLLL